MESPCPRNYSPGEPRGTARAASPKADARHRRRCRGRAGPTPLAREAGEAIRTTPEVAPQAWLQARSAVADRDPHRLRTLAIVPALNEQHAIPGVIADIRDADPSIDVVIVDDGSTDATAEVARAAGARVIRLPFNLGIGGAVQTGFRVARDEGYDVAIQIDGDGQHPADQVDTLLAAVRAGANYVIGSRFAAPSEYRASRARRSGMILLSRLVSLIVRARITDTTSGFRAADKRTIGLFASHYPHDYPEVEAIVLARRNGLRVQEVPVLMRARTTGRSSITPLKSGYYMAKVVLAVLVQCLGRAPRRDEGELER